MRRFCRAESEHQIESPDSQKMRELKIKVNDVEISVVYYRYGYDPKHYENDVNKITPTPTSTPIPTPTPTHN